MKWLLWFLALAGCGRTAFDEELAPSDLGVLIARDLSTVNAPADLACDALNACGKCEPPPVEECNGRDDDCDGIVDEKCVGRLDPTAHVNLVRIDGDRAVLQTGRGYNSDPGGGVLWTDWGTAIHIVDVPKHMSTVLQGPRPPSDMGYVFDSNPAVDGDEVVWYFSNNSSSDSTGSYTLRNLVSGARQDFSSPTLRNLGPPALSAGRVVFAAQGVSNGDYDVFLWSPPDPTPRPLTFPSVDERGPDLDGDWVVYERRDTQSGPAHVRAINLADGRMRWPSENLDGSHTEPAISGTRVVWSRYLDAPPDPPRWEVWLYDLASDERRVIASNASAARIDGTLVCFSGVNNSQYPSQYGISAHEVTSGRTLRLSGHGLKCDVSGRRVVWLDGDVVGAVLMRELLSDEP